MRYAISWDDDLGAKVTKIREWVMIVDTLGGQALKHFMLLI